MKQWNEGFKKYGRIFLKPQEDVIKIDILFKKHGVKRVLDLGCGSGRHVVYLVKCGFDVYGIDIAEAGIKLTKEWLTEEKLKANLKVGNIYEKLPYKDNFFDAVLFERVGSVLVDVTLAVLVMVVGAAGAVTIIVTVAVLPAAIPPISHVTANPALLHVP